MVTADGAIHESGAPTMTYGVRGIAGFELRVKHASRDVHSGNFGGVVPNPIWTLVQLLATMKDAAGEITIKGLHDAIVPPTEFELAAAARLPLDLDETRARLGLTRLDLPPGGPYYDRLMFHPTLTINGLHGGYAGPGVKAMLPFAAFAKCDIRLVEAMTPDDVLGKVEAHVRKYAPEVRLIALGGMLPSRVPMATPYGALRHRLAQGVLPLEYPSMGGSLPDYVFTKILRIPAFVVPYANADEANHEPNENLKIDCIRTGAALLDRVGAGGG